MTSSSFYEEGSRLLTPGAFEFVLDSELKRAVRSQNFLTLVTLEASREWEGMQMSADDGTVQQVAQLIGREVRDTDLLGHTDRGMLALAEALGSSGFDVVRFNFPYRERSSKVACENASLAYSRCWMVVFCSGPSFCDGHRPPLQTERRTT